MLRIRLQRFGTKNEPTYRLVVAEQHIRRDGRFVEVLGHYNPSARGKAAPLVINVERVDHGSSSEPNLPTQLSRWLNAHARRLKLK